MRFKTAKGEAPGRLDFMGGVADYSGSLVLQMPVKGVTKVIAREMPERVFKFRSEDNQTVTIPNEIFLELLKSKVDLRDLRKAVDESNCPFWTRYVIGSLLVFCTLKRWLPKTGLEFSISSTVPQSMGVSSSAALEISSLRCIANLAGKSFKGTELARMGQTVENHIVGAPCGLMDQLASSYGKKGHLLPILCRPDQLHKPIKLPENTLVVGWPSGIKHAVSGSPYAKARCAAFMGKAILEKETGNHWGFTSEISPSLFKRNQDKLPVQIIGSEFLAANLKISDSISVIQTDDSYPVRDATSFPIHENSRCHLAEKLLRSGRSDEETNRLVGELIYQSHEGYGAMGLGCPEVDQMIDALKNEGPKKGIYGARISGGGCGGTVSVFIHRKGLTVLKKLQQKIKFQKEPLPLIF